MRGTVLCVGESSYMKIKKSKQQSKSLSKLMKP